MSRDRSFFSPVGTTDGPSSPSSSPKDSHAVDMSTSASANNRPSPQFPVDARLGAKSAAPSPAGLGSMAPILAYCASSILMTVVNKYVLSGKHFSMNLVVLLIQSAVGVIVVLGARQAKLIQIREWNTKDARNWAPISFLLVMVIWTGSKALQYLAIPVYTIFKNLTIILIAYGEVIWFGGKITRLTMLSFLLMVLSSVIAAWSDISRLSLLSSLSMPHSPDFLDAVTKDPNTGADVHAYDPMRETKMKLDELSGSLGGPSNGINDEVFEGLGGFGALNSGYVWMALNCAVSAAYVLAMRKRIKLTGFKDWDTMYFNNLLSIPCLLIMSFLVEDWSRESLNINFPAETRTSLLSAIVFSGACAVFISYTTAWCIRVTSSTTYSMVGALNKLPIALSGAIFQPLDAGTGGGIFVGFLSGIVYAVAKNRQAAANAAANSTAATGLGMGERGSANQKAGVIPMHSMPLMADHREGAEGSSRPGSSSGGDDYARDRKD